MTSSPGLDPAQLDRLLARKRKKFSRNRKISTSTTPEDEEHPSSVNTNIADFEEINIQSDLNPSIDHASTHVYQWVVVMEHQRGFTLFKTPHYSVASLLPNDPPPFQFHDSVREQPRAITNFDEYTLPSPLWYWVSRFWMVDMRGDGEVDSNGWQYGSTFSTSTWSSRVKSFNRGGWVRRRRWVRLMVKPANLSNPQKEQPVLQQPDSIPIWKGDEEDWARCCKALKTRSTDGRKLELWKSWLLDEKSSALALNTIVSQLEEILRSFIYPETRTHFLLILRDVRSDSNHPIALNEFTSDFWSYENLFSKSDL